MASRYYTTRTNHYDIQLSGIRIGSYPRYHSERKILMNAATIAAIATGVVSIIGAVTALIQSLRNRNTITNHIASHNQDKPS